jgi:hypothetical protein
VLPLEYFPKEDPSDKEHSTPLNPSNPIHVMNLHQLNGNFRQMLLLRGLKKSFGEMHTSIGENG